MNYDTLRHFADSWGLIFMGVLWLSFALWLFRPGAARHHRDAAHMIFAEDDRAGHARTGEHDDDR